jgi:hypothetical protein
MTSRMPPTRHFFEFAVQLYRTAQRMRQKGASREVEQTILNRMAHEVGAGEMSLRRSYLRIPHRARPTTTNLTAKNNPTTITARVLAVAIGSALRWS